MRLVEELIERNYGVAVIDGGLATQLEALGADINGPLWSARCLISDPHLIKQVIHRLFLMHRIGLSLGYSPSLINVCCCKLGTMKMSDPLFSGENRWRSW